MAGNLPVTTTTFETELQAKINTVGGATPIEDIISYYRAGENIPTINNTALTTEVQIRLDAVSSSTTAVEFLELAASFGKISNTNQADLQSALLAIADIPTNSELATALSPLATSAELAPLATSAELTPLATSTDVSDSEANVISAINSQGGGIAITWSFSGALLHVVSSVNPLVISPSSGKSLVLEFLSSSSTTPIPSVTITCGSRVVVDALDLSWDANSPGAFLVAKGNYPATGDIDGATGWIEKIICNPDEVITISTPNSGNLRYSFSEF